MKKRIKKYTLYYMVLLILMFMGSGISEKADAASCEIRFSLPQEKIEKGEQFSVVCQVTSATAFVDAEFTIAYDNERMKFVEGGKKISGGGGELLVSSVGNEDETYKKTFSLQFKAKKRGSGLIYVKDMPEITDAEGNTFSVSGNRVSIHIEKKEDSAEKTDDTNRTESTNPSDGLNPSGAENQTGELSPSGAENQTGELSPYGAGNQTGELSPSDAENQTSELNPSETVMPEKTKAPEKSDVFGLQFAASQDGGRIKLQNSYSFWVEEVDDNVQIPDGYSKTKIEIDGVTMKAYMKDKDSDGNYLLMYLKSSSGNTGWYRYDRVERTLQRYAESLEAQTEKDSAKDDKKTEYIMFVIIAVLVFVIIGLLVVLLRKKPREDAAPFYKESDREDEIEIFYNESDRENDEIENLEKEQENREEEQWIR